MAISTLNTTDTFNTWRTLFNNLVNEHNSGSTSIVDGDDDTKVQVEESSDEDIIRFDTGGTERMTIAADGAIAIAGAITGSSTIQGTTITATTAFVPDASDGAALGTSSLEFSDLFLADGAVISFGADQDVTVTHDPDDGLFLKSAATADDNPVLLTLQTGETDLAADDVIGKIAFQAPDEGTGTDAILVSAAIQAVAEGDHSSSSNATTLQFMTGASEAATAKAYLKSDGSFGLNTTPSYPFHLKVTTANADHLVIESTEAGANEAPGLALWRNSGSPADNDNIGRIRFYGEDDGGNIQAYGQIVTKILDVTNGTEDSQIAFTTFTAGSETTVLELRTNDAYFDNDIYLDSDNAVLNFGADADVKITHDPDDGLFIKSTATGDDNPLLLTLQTGETDLAADDVIGKIAFQAPDEGTGTDAILVSAAIQAVAEGDHSSSSNATTLSFMTGASEAAAAKLNLTSGGDVKVLTDGASIFFGADSEIELRHVADDGLIIKHVGTGDGKEPSLTFQAGDNDIAANDVLGSIFFQAPDEGAGTDAILVAAGIEAVSEGDFSSSNNATKLSFKTAASAAAAETMSLSSAGLLTTSAGITSGAVITSGAGLVIANAGNIGSVGDTDAIAIASNGVTTFSQAPVFPDGSLAIIDLDIDGGTDIGEAIVDADLFIIDNGAGGTNRKTAASRLLTYAMAGTLTAAAQTNITSLGTLSALAISGSTTNTIAGSHAITLSINSTATNPEWISFEKNGSDVGEIYWDPSADGGAILVYGTSSDYRLKTDVETIEDVGLEKILQLRPVTYRWKNSHIPGSEERKGKNTGFIAHEIQEAGISGVATRTKDAIKEDGTPDYQSVDASHLVPYLVKAIQELKAEIDELKEK